MLNASWTSAKLTSFGPNPAISYAILEARTVISGVVISRKPLVNFPDTRMDPLIQIGWLLYFRALSALHRTAAAAPSPIGQHIKRVSGSAIIREFRTSSTVVSLLNWAWGFCEAHFRLLTTTLARCSGVAPYSAM